MMQDETGSVIIITFLQTAMPFCPCHYLFEQAFGLFSDGYVMLRDAVALAGKCYICGSMIRVLAIPT